MVDLLRSSSNWHQRQRLANPMTLDFGWVFIAMVSKSMEKGEMILRHPYHPLHFGLVGYRETLRLQLCGGLTQFSCSAPKHEVLGESDLGRDATGWQIKHIFGEAVSECSKVDRFLHKSWQLCPLGSAFNLWTSLSAEQRLWTRHAPWSLSNILSWHRALRCLGLSLAKSIDQEQLQTYPIKHPVIFIPHTPRSALVSFEGQQCGCALPPSAELASDWLNSLGGTSLLIWRVKLEATNPMSW